MTNIEFIFNNIKNLKILSDIDIKILLKKHDKKTIINHNIRLVMYLARKYKTNINYYDVIQEGMLGLIHALDMYNLKFNVRFSTYAIPWIKHYIVKYFKKEVQNNHEDIDNMEISDNFNIENIILDIEKKENTQKIINKNLYDGYKTVFNLLYNFDTNHRRTLREVGDIIGTSVERVRQIRNKGIRILKKEGLIYGDKRCYSYQNR